MKVLSDEVQIMVPFSQRRHRLNGYEVPLVMEAVEFQLRQLLEDKENLLTSSILFKVYYRLREHVTNRPSYPSHSTWEEISSYLSYGTISREEGA